MNQRVHRTSLITKDFCRAGLGREYVTSLWHAQLAPCCEKQKESTGVFFTTLFLHSLHSEPCFSFIVQLRLLMG